MVIAPSGKRRLMVAQRFTDPTAQRGGEMANDSVDLSGVGSASELAPNTVDNFEHKIKEEETEQASPDEGSTEADLTDYLFEKLEGWGYPGRRLVEFRNKFVSENISAEGDKTVDAVIPSTYYGTNKQISDKDFASMIKEIKHKFGLFFAGATNAEGKLTVKFTSVNKREDEGMVEEDELTKVYGQPAGGGSEHKESPKVAGLTIHEMIKNNKSNMVEELLRLLGAK
tara:strand:+ start:2400 stop:3080 length:681 start_codon:yes stop_codon:yes gene_type:complete